MSRRGQYLLFTALVLRDETIAFLARLGFAPAWLARLS